MKKISLFFMVAGSMYFYTSCKVQHIPLNEQSVIRQAENAPDHFNPPPYLTLDTKTCKNPMLDSRNGTKITLLSAQDGLGKYEVPNGTYGVKKGECLLLDCSTGQVKGIIPLK